MTDFKKELISILEREIPELLDKIQAGAVDERTAAPFAAFSSPEKPRKNDARKGCQTNATSCHAGRKRMQRRILSLNSQGIR